MESTMMLHVPGTLWQDLGTTYKDVKATTSEELISHAKCNYSVSYHSMSDDISPQIQGYHAVRRDDTDMLLGVVNNRNPEAIQNVNTFKIVEPLIKSGDVSVDTVSEFNNGKAVFGIFKINQPYIVQGDQVQHYLIVVNDHLKPTGKIQVINTPVRICCMNALSHAISKSVYSISVPVFGDYDANTEISKKILAGCASAIDNLNYKAERLRKQKLTVSEIQEITDKLFPIPEPVPESIGSRGNEKAIETAIMIQDQFRQCLDADNLDDFRGTAYQVFNALTDFNQHYFKSGKTAFDLDTRMQKLPGIGTLDTDASKIVKLVSKFNAKAA